MRYDYLTKCPTCKRETDPNDACADCGVCIDCVVTYGHKPEGHPDWRLRSIGGNVPFSTGEE